jgi:chromosome segregation ATPase
MTEKLAQLEKEIDDRLVQRSQLVSQISGYKAQLEEAQHQQKQAVLDQVDTTELRTKIRDLRNDIDGRQAEINVLTDRLATLREERDRELTRIRLAHAEIARQESRLIVKEIYILLVQVVEKLAELSEKNAEYKKFIKINDPHEDNLQRQFNRNTTLREILANGLYRFVDAFAVDIFDSEGLASVESLRRILKPWATTRR